MTFKELTQLINSDLYRYDGKKGYLSGAKTFFNTPGFKYTLVLRICRYFMDKRTVKIVYAPLRIVSKMLLRRYQYKFGIQIPPEIKLGKGFYIGHYGGIVVNMKADIGNNCNISHGVTLGQANRGKNKGFPIVGDNVYLGPGCKVVGAVKIGNNAAIGANCVVTRDVPDNAVVVGVPGKVISLNGSMDYINNKA